MPGKRRTRDEWQQLMAEFDAGTERASEFCRRHEITSSNFYKRRTALTRASSSVFVATQRAALPAAVVTVQINEIAIRCDAHTPAAWISELVGALRG